MVVILGCRRKCDHMIPAYCVDHTLLYTLLEPLVIVTTHRFCFLIKVLFLGKSMHIDGL